MIKSLITIEFYLFIELDMSMSHIFFVVISLNILFYMRLALLLGNNFIFQGLLFFSLNIKNSKKTKKNQEKEQFTFNTP